MIGSASGCATPAHIRLEPGGKGGWVAEEEIISCAQDSERMSLVNNFVWFVGVEVWVGSGEKKK